MANYDLTYEGSEVQKILDTGDELQTAGYIFRGEATPSTVPGTPTERVAYIGGPGTYTNFGTSTEISAGCIGVFKYNGSAWSIQVINTGLSAAITTEAGSRANADGLLQNAISAINAQIGNGYVYAGVATPSTEPVSGKVFYLAITDGTYTNFEDSEETPLTVTAGINILKNTGTGWVLDQIIAIDAEPTQGSANLVKSGGVLNSIIQNGPAFDLSAYNAVGGTLATYADLSAALTVLNALPAAYKKGGMSVKFVQSSDNEYVQYRLIANDFTTDITKWQGEDKETYANSPNFVSSNGITKNSFVINLPCKGNTLAKATIKSIKENRKYRINIKNPDISIANVTSPDTAIRFGILAFDKTGAQIGYSVYRTFGTRQMSLDDFFDINTPTGTDYIQIMARADNGLILTSIIEDITLSDTPYKVSDFNLVPTENIFTSMGMVSGIINGDGFIVNTAATAGSYTTDYISVEENTTYYLSYKINVFGVRIVAFYNDYGFISRQVSSTEEIYSFTTPANCTHIRLSKLNFISETRKDIVLSKNGIIPNIYNKTLKYINLGKEDDLKTLKYTNYGLERYIDNPDVLNVYINNQNKWVFLQGSSAFLIKVKPYQKIQIQSTKEYNAIYAYLKSPVRLANDDVNIVYEYNQIVDEIDGSVTFEIVVDEYGNPVLDERHTIPRNTIYTESVPPETEYLYIMAKTVSLDEVIQILPNFVSIDGIIYNDTIIDEPEISYETVFFDDFNEPLNTDIWTMHTQPKAVDGRYNSRFKTSSDNVFTDQGCLVMRCSKTATQEDGTYKSGEDEHGEPILSPVQYIGSYISTADSFAIKKGRISARMKFSKNTNGELFPAAFWTFGQNADWPYAHEMDIAEASGGMEATQDATTSDGNTIWAGSHLSTFAAHTHARNATYADMFKEKFYQIVWARYHNGEYVDTLKYLNIADLTEWHVYSVVWDETTITYFVDDNPIISYSAEKYAKIEGQWQSATDDEGNIGFFYPQDIRFNIKASRFNVDEESYLFVDWVKAESQTITPCVSITHNDVDNLSVGDSFFIRPVFNQDCTNEAFTVELAGYYTEVTYDDGAPKLRLNGVLVEPYKRDGQNVSCLYKMSNGKYYTLDNNFTVWKECDEDGHIIGEDNIVFPIGIDNGVVLYQKYGSLVSAVTYHLMIATHSGDTDVQLNSANRNATTSFNVSVD